jgi:hypothetical protein
MRVIEMVLLATVVGIGNAGCCEKVTKKVATRATEIAVEKASGGDASVRIGDDVDISDLHKSFQYPGARAKGRLSQTSSSDTGTTYIMESSDAYSKVKTHYEGMKGYKEVMKMDTSDGAIYSYEDTSSHESFHVTVTESGGKTLITVMHSKKKS